MSKVKMSAEIPVPPGQLWSLIGGFNALPDWHPAVQTSQVEGGGSMRRLTLVGGGEIVERLVHSDDRERTYSYEIVNSPLPIMNYRATIKVRENEDGSKSVVEWSGDFTATGPEADVVQTVQGIYQAGLDNLKKMFGG